MNSIILKPGYVKGCVAVPSSKSVAHRALIAAAFSDKMIRVKKVDFSKDIYATMDALRQLGVTIKEEKDFILVDGSTIVKGSEVSINANESGSTLRFMIPVATLLEKTVTFDGKGRLPERPLDDYFEIFDKLGVEYSCPEGKYLPLKVSGDIEFAKVNVKGNTSSQFITGLIFCGLVNSVKVNITTELQSKPYVDITVDVLKKFGCIINENDNSYEIKKTPTLIDEYSVERDWSQAAFFMCAAAINGCITLKEMNMDSAQGDMEIISLLKKFGACIKINGSDLTVEKSDLHGIEIDVGDIPDLVPTLSVLACFAKGKTKIYNAARLRIKESDRLQAMYEELAKLGADVEIGEDYLIINGGKPLHGAEVDSHNDHRIAMAMAVASVGCEGDVILNGHSAVSKSYPHFFEDWSNLNEQYFTKEYKL